MTNRFHEAFARAREEGRPAFLPYVTAGFPTREDTVPILLAMEAGGSDGIELGVPFTDPLADGATVQHANQVAVENGVTFAEVLGMVAEARSRGLTIPVALMGYFNPILAYGVERVAADAAAAGVDGFIVVDLTPEEGGEFIAGLRRSGLSFIPLVTPTTGEERMELLAGAGDSWLYCVSVTGTTGQRSELPPDLAEFIARVRKHTSLPLGVGFGISRREHVEAVGRIADAAVIGSAIIAVIDAAGDRSRADCVREFVEDVTGRTRHEV